MDEIIRARSTSRRSFRSLWLGVGIVVFGLLMGVRGEFGGMWERALIAAGAAAVLAFSLTQWRKAR